MEAGNRTITASYDKASMCSQSHAAFVFWRGGVKADISLRLQQEGSLFPLVLYLRKWKAGLLWSNLLGRHINDTDGIGWRCFQSGRALTETCRHTRHHWFVSFETLSTASGKERWQPILDVEVCTKAGLGRVKQRESAHHYSCLLRWKVSRFSTMCSYSDVCGFIYIYIYFIS